MAFRLLQLLCISHAAFTSIIFGLMLISFPLGMYLLFNADIDENINFDYPLESIAISDAIGIDFFIPLGYLFVSIWCIYLGLFTISLLGPQHNIVGGLRNLIDVTTEKLNTNNLSVVIKWFGILVFASVVVIIVQGLFGITTEYKQTEPLLIEYFYVSLAPIIEEFGFRLFLIGIPLFFIAAPKLSFKQFGKFLWHPNLKLQEKKIAVIPLIIISSIIFGVLHILIGDEWTMGKLLQASIAGVILGYIYVRYGLVCSILIHWGANYLIFTYVVLVADTNMISLDNAMSHSFISAIQLVFLVAGSVGTLMTILVYSRNKSLQKVF